MATSNSSRKRRASALEGKPASTSNPSTEAQSKHDLFTSYSLSQGIRITSVKASQISGRGIGLVTNSSIKKDEQILFVPEKAMFKPNSSRLGKVVYETLAKTASPQALLAICLAAEFQSRSSGLDVWRNTWPSEGELLPTLPFTWSKDLQSLLPKSMESPLARQSDDYAKDVKVFISVFGSDDEISEEKFKYFWSIVNSRSFHFKPGNTSRRSNGASSNSRAIVGGYMVLCPFIDCMNHGPSGSGVNVRQTPQGYEVTADRDYETGEEILATYGPHPNEKLLLHYGFILPHDSSRCSSDDEIRLDHHLLPRLSPSTLTSLQDVGYYGSYSLLPPSANADPSSWTLCFKSQVAVRAELLTSNEWEYFIGSGEDMSGDKSDVVREYIVEHVMPGLMSEAEGKLREIDAMLEREKDGKRETALHLLSGRWKQIRDGGKAYIKGGG